MHQTPPSRKPIYYIHISMATGEPDFFNITIESGNVATIGVHFHKALRKEFDSTFIKSKCMSEMARVCYRRGGGDVNIFLDQAQRRHRIPSQSQYTWYEGHDKGIRHTRLPQKESSHPPNRAPS